MGDWRLGGAERTRLCPARAESVGPLQTLSTMPAGHMWSCTFKVIKS